MEQKVTKDTIVIAHIGMDCAAHAVALAAIKCQELQRGIVIVDINKEKDIKSMQQLYPQPEAKPYLLTRPIYNADNFGKIDVKLKTNKPTNFIDGKIPKRKKR